jgi:hypothetical protein
LLERINLISRDRSPITEWESRQLGHKMNLPGSDLDPIKEDRMGTGELPLPSSGKMPTLSITKIITEVHYAYA